MPLKLESKLVLERLNFLKVFIYICIYILVTFYLPEIPPHKTPKRILRKQQFNPNHESPVTDPELQQDIYWDQHSPTTFKLGNGRKTCATSQRAVEISDVVNRIAPQQSPEVSLNMWLGADAIQCSPALSYRERIKANYSRFQRSTDEELMKLAKEFDRTMVEQDVSYGDEGNEILDDEDSEQTLHIKRASRHFPTLGNVPETPIAEPVEDDGSGALPRSQQSSSQRSLDLEAEAAVNALFDGPTQHVSRPLSQGLSEDESSSPKFDHCHVAKAAWASVKGNTGRGVNTTASRIGEPTVPFPTASNDTDIPQVSSPIVLDPPDKGPFFGHATVSKCDTKLVCGDSTVDFVLDRGEETNVPSKGRAGAAHTSESEPADDGFDDWMEDDSFIQQITQFPELGDSAAKSQSLQGAGHKVTRDSDHANNPQGSPRTGPPVSPVPSSTSSPSDIELAAKICQFGQGSERAKPRITFSLQSNTCRKVTEEQPVAKCQLGKDCQSLVNTLLKRDCGNSDASTPQRGSLHAPVRALSSLASATPFKRATWCDGSVERSSLASQRPARWDGAEWSLAGGLRAAGKSPPRAAADVEMQSTLSPFPPDDWNDAEFYSEIQDMFPESESLWETSDDDLNRMCDDVEKRIEDQNSDPTLPAGTVETKGANGNRILTSDVLRNQLNGQQKHSNQNQTFVIPERKICSREQGQFVAKHNALPALGPQPGSTDLICTVCTTATPPTQSHHLNSAGNIQGQVFTNTSKVCGVNFNGLPSVTGWRYSAHASNVPRTLAAANFDGGQSVQTPGGNAGQPGPRAPSSAGIARTPRFTFSKITTSSLAGIPGNSSSSSAQCEKVFVNRDLHERCVQSAPSTKTTCSPTPSLKRHFSDSTLVLKVGELAGRRSAKCSLQEIENKKQAAVARRKMKMQASCNHPPTV
ncbi:ewing's tumor-associated antigen 1-like isoform X2 [Leucoraja erinacea]|uniref:ewing's tumor-associated antigen 1-like isoform X2 n=1 Tax=Leucoraja erinaceus TaxID=7782 RepID=UPI00245648FF|nr:ewing's tumor-associated antigen 1-like isoform X2 [Leucoraja erinacea]